MVMVWNTVTWANDDIVTETKLNNMQGNAAHVRDEMSGRPILSGASASANVSGVAQIRLGLWIGEPETLLGYSSGLSGYDVWAQRTIANVSLSGVPVGVAALRLSCDLWSGSVWTLGPNCKSYFYRTSDMNFITTIAEIRQIGAAKSFRSGVVFGHLSSGDIV